MSVTGPSVGVARRVVIYSAGEVRHAIAHFVLGDDEAARSAIPARLGSIRLRPHQIDAAVRLERLMVESGGAMLADEVGLGKTYVALALVRGAEHPLVAAPAALIPMWESALQRARCVARLVSFEHLSRVGGAGTLPLPGPPGLVVVDEAHHVRTPTTRRYAALAKLCARSLVLLLSATPLHNSRRDLAAQLALFLGSAAWTMDDTELAQYVVRRTRGDVRIEEGAPPAVAAPVWVELPTDDDCLEQLLALPPPLPPADGGDGGALLVYSLVRQWASSRAALRGALRRRLARAAALAASLESGRYPSRVQLSAWSYAEGTVQLAFPELVTSPVAGDGPAARDVAGLLAAVRTHDAGIRALLQRLDETADPDLDRAAAIRAVRKRHPRERVIAFAESAETVEAMFRLLRSDRGVAMLRAGCAAVSGGTLSRREVLARFSPVAQGASEPHESERVDLLLATDLLSEGVNLQDASVVVHLDLPWNPARLEQRVGRVSRIGSRHDRVSVYALRPPAGAERLLEVERRLCTKLSEAGRTIGVVGAILPGLGGSPEVERGAAGDWTRIVAALRGWRAPYAHVGAAERRSQPESHDVVRAAAVSSPTCGFLAAIAGTPRPILLASLGGGEPADAPSVVAAALESAAGDEIAVDRRALDDALRAVERWVGRRAAADISGLEQGALARARRRVLARITRVASRAPRHLRSIIGPLAAEARRAALMPLTEGAERVLAELADARLADQAWLRALGAFGELHRRLPDAARRGAAPTMRPVALLLLGDAGAAGYV